MYNTCVTLAEANGWLEEEQTNEFLNGFYEMVLEVQAVAEDASVAGSEEALKALVTVIEEYMNTTDLYLPYWEEPYEA